MNTFFQDVRYAIRALRRNAALTIVIVASLAIGIGANTAVFSVVNALLLKPLPYPDAERLAVLWLRSPGINIPQDWPSPGQYLDIQQQNRSFDAMSISRGRVSTLIGRDQAERVESLETSASLFPLLGARALHGRLLRTEEDVPGQTPVVILSHAFWQRAFASDPAIVGKLITLNGLGSGAGEARNRRSAGPSACPPFSTGSNRSPCRSTRSSASRIPKSRGRTFSPSSSQRSGVDTGAPGFGRTE